MNERETICEIGKRLYEKEFVAAHEGNLSIRIADGKILCTPTLKCKGMLDPDELCVVDLDGNVISGHTKPTSEIKLHLTVYQNRPDVNSVVHSHPPHATAFAVAREPVPNCVLAEPDLFLGEIAIAPYATPGTREFADSIIPFVENTNAILLANHGVVTYGESLEKAFWMTEVLDATCRILLLSKILGGPKRLTGKEGRALAQKRANFGFQDPRPIDDNTCDVCDHFLFKSTWASSGVTQNLFQEAVSSLNQTPTGEISLDQTSCEQIAELVAQKLRDSDN